MKRTMWVWQLLGFGVVSLGGTLLHFLYDWTGKSVIAAPFSGVNESTFEHIKLLFWPMLAFAVVQWFFFRDYADFWCVKLAGFVTGIAAIPTIFYTYNGAFGKSPDWLNITIFFVSAAMVFWTELRLFNKQKFKKCNAKAAFFAICLMAVGVVYFTFNPPEIPLFMDPLTGGYGIL